MLIGLVNRLKMYSSSIMFPWLSTEVFDLHRFIWLTRLNAVEMSLEKVFIDLILLDLSHGCIQTRIQSLVHNFCSRWGQKFVVPCIINSLLLSMKTNNFWMIHVEGNWIPITLWCHGRCPNWMKRCLDTKHEIPDTSIEMDAD